MTTLKSLNIEIVNILDKITEQWSHMTPIDQLIILTNKLNNPTSNIHLSEPKTTVDILKNILTHQQESLLLYFATKNQNDNTYSINFEQSITNELSVITKLMINPIFDQLQSTFIKHKDCDIEFDLTYIDKYQEDDRKPMAYVTSYLYGNPYLEEWENRHRTYFHDIKNVINNDNEEN